MNNIKHEVMELLGRDFEIIEYFAVTPSKLFDYLESNRDELFSVNTLIITYKKNNPVNNFTIILTFDRDTVSGNYIITRNGERFASCIEFPLQNLERVLKALLLLFMGSISEKTISRVTVSKKK